MRRKLTQNLIDSLPTKPKRYIVMDTVMPGLGVKVSPKGRKTFVAVGRWNSDHPTRRSLGLCVSMTIEDAREATRALHSAAGSGTRSPRPAETTFGQLCWQFLKHIETQRRSHDVENGVKREFLPRWKDRPLHSVTRSDLLEVTDAAIARGSPWAAHHAWANARRIFNFAIARGLIEKSPCDRVRPRDVIGPKLPRQRVLTDDEIRSLWRASKTINYPYGPLWQILLITGQRKTEIAEARWVEIDTTSALLTVPPERFKSNATHIVPLSPLALSVMREMPQDQDRLFGSINGFSKAKGRLDDAMGRPPHFVIHDIRRTVRTRLAALRVPHEVAEMVIGHGRKGLARVYDQHRYLNEMREALDAWSKEILRLIA